MAAQCTGFRPVPGPDSHLQNRILTRRHRSPTVRTEPEAYFFVFLDLKIGGGGVPNPAPSRTLGSRVGGGGMRVLSSNLHPSPNSRWLHHTALRYMRRVQLGAYTWRKGLNLVKTGSNWAQNTWLSKPNGLRSLLEKHIFDPFWTHFWSHNGPFSRHFGLFHGAKRVISGSKWAKNTCLSIPNGQRSLLEKCVFDPFLTHFWS